MSNRRIVIIIVGHRGARKEAPENTVEGFVHAQQNGCRHFELDIQLSSDNQLIVFHDSKLYRTTGESGKLANKPYAELKQLDARRNTPDWPAPCFIPNLQSVVDAVPQTLHWQFEVKSASHKRLSILAQQLNDFISSNNLSKSITVTSSNRWFLRHIKHKKTDIQTGYVAEYRLPNPVKTAVGLDCDYLVLNEQLADSIRLTHAKESGLHVSCWTVNDLDKMIALENIGVDSIITDIPSAAIERFQ